MADGACITKAQFDAMSPAEKQKLIDQTKQEIEAKLKKEMNEKIAKITSGTVMI